MKKSFFLLFTIAILSSCSNDDNIKNDEIVSEWQLMEARFSGLAGGNNSESSINYSNQNIVYNFKSNGILIVSGGENVGYPDGEYQYIFGEDQLGGDINDPQLFLVRINDSKWTYDLTNGIMTLGKSYVDGPDLVFERK